MSAAPYLPRVDSLADKVCRYFVRMPDDELLSREIASNYGTTASNVSGQLASAVEAQYLQVDGSVYSAGKEIGLYKRLVLEPATASRAGDGAVAPSTPKPRAPRRVSKPFQLDLSAVQVEQGHAIPPNHRTGMDWAGLFDRLQVGDSFALPADGRASVQKAATAYKRATGRAMAVRMVADGLRVWRVS